MMVPNLMQNTVKLVIKVMFSVHFNAHLFSIDVNIQLPPVRKPRNFYEEMPEGIEDNFIDEQFLQGLAHKSKCLLKLYHP